MEIHIWLTNGLLLMHLRLYKYSLDVLTLPKAGITSTRTYVLKVTTQDGCIGTRNLLKWLLVLNHLLPFQVKIKCVKVNH